MSTLNSKIHLSTIARAALSASSLDNPAPPSAAEKNTRSADGAQNPSTTFEQRLDALEMPQKVRGAVGALNPYLPDHIGPLVAKEYLMDSRSIRTRTKFEAGAAGVIGYFVTSAIMSLNAVSTMTPSSLAVESLVGAAAVVAMYSIRAGLNLWNERTAKTIGNKNYAYSPLFLNAAEALDAADDARPGTSTQLLALRHALVDIPLMAKCDASNAATRILKHAENSYEGRLIHIDAITAYATFAIHPKTSASDLNLFARSILSCLSPSGDVLERAEMNLLRRDVAHRLKELRDVAPEIAIALFRAKFEDPRVTCDSLQLACEIIKIINHSKADPVLNALKDNCVEALLAHIHEIPSLAVRLRYLKKAQNIRDLYSDQKILIASSIRKMTDAIDARKHELVEAARTSTSPDESSAHSSIPLGETPKTRRAA